MDSNNKEQIRIGLTNFLGALINSMDAPKKEISQEVVAILQEESLRLIKEEDNKCNLYIAKPLFKALIYIFSNRVNELQNENNDIFNESINDYKKYIKMLNTFISNIKE